MATIDLAMVLRAPYFMLLFSLSHIVDVDVRYEVVHVRPVDLYSIIFPIHRSIERIVGYLPLCVRREKSETITREKRQEKEKITSLQK